MSTRRALFSTSLGTFSTIRGEPLPNRHLDHSQQRDLCQNRDDLPVPSLPPVRPTALYMSITSLRLQASSPSVRTVGRPVPLCVQPRIKHIQRRSARTNHCCRVPKFPPHDAHIQAHRLLLCGTARRSCAKAGESRNVAMMRDYVRPEDGPASGLARPGVIDREDERPIY